jgi:hypothetical protein
VKIVNSQPVPITIDCRNKEKLFAASTFTAIFGKEFLAAHGVN